MTSTILTCRRKCLNYSGIELFFADPHYFTKCDKNGYVRLNNDGKPMVCGFGHRRKHCCSLKYGRKLANGLFNNELTNTMPTLPHCRPLPCRSPSLLFFHHHYCHHHHLLTLSSSTSTYTNLQPHSPHLQPTKTHPLLLPLPFLFLPICSFPRLLHGIVLDAACVPLRTPSSPFL